MTRTTASNTRSKDRVYNVETVIDSEALDLNEYARLAARILARAAYETTARPDA